ncbi:MAG: porin [Burkholderiales bacterium]|jgi:predicted porin
MQKKLIALAVASAAAAISAPAFAQSQVSVYGIIDVGIESAKFNDADSNVTRMFNGGYNTNRIGFKGSEDLGNGMKANFVLEGQPSPDVGTHGAQFWGRLATLGLSSNSWGSVNLGRQYTPWFSARAANDIFYTAGSGSNYSLEGGDTRMSNSIRYDSTNINGFTFAAMYGMGEQVAGVAADTGDEGLTSATKKAGRSAGLNLAYANGPLALRYGYDQQTITLAPDTDMKRNNINGSYDFKVVKVVAGWNSAKQNAVTDVRSWYVGGVVPVFGSDKVKLEYTRLNDKLVSNKDSRLIALGYEHPMSKRTTLYATYAKMDNDGAATRSFLTGGGVVTAGFDPSSFQFGMAHSF